MFEWARWLWRVRLWCAWILLFGKGTLQEIDDWRRLEEWLGLVSRRQERVDRQQREMAARLDRIEERLRDARGAVVVVGREPMDGRTRMLWDTATETVVVPVGTRVRDGGRRRGARGTSSVSYSMTEGVSDG